MSPLIQRNNNNKEPTVAPGSDDNNNNNRKQTPKKKKQQQKQKHNRHGCFFVSCIALWSIVALLIIASKLYSAAHTVDPCLKAQQSLRLIEQSSSSSSNNTNKSSISSLPKIIHQQWKDTTIPPNSKFERWHEAWLNKFPNHTHMLWTDDLAEQLIREHYSWFLSTYINYEPHIKRVDSARYFILHKFGGIYADMDYEPLINFEKYLPIDKPSFVESPHQYAELHQNSLMSSPPHHPFWNMTFEMLMERADLPVLYATGPSFIDDVITKYNSQEQQQQQSDGDSASAGAYTLPCENFHRIPSGQDNSSPWFTRLWNQLILGKLYPMKYCGDFALTNNKNNCQFGRHHNVVSWMSNGLWKSFLENFISSS